MFSCIGSNRHRQRIPIILTAAFENQRLGRVVLLAPPNQGTPTAKVINSLFCLFSKGVSELSDRPGSLVRRLQPSSSLELGIIAGRYDWIVPKSRTPLQGQRDHTCLTATHNTMLVQPSVARQVVEFLRHGRFQHQRKSELQND